MYEKYTSGTFNRINIFFLFLYINVGILFNYWGLSDIEVSDTGVFLNVTREGHKRTAKSPIENLGD